MVFSAGARMLLFVPGTHQLRCHPVGNASLWRYWHRGESTEQRELRHRVWWYWHAEKVQSSASPTRPRRDIGSGGTGTEEKVQSSASSTRPRRGIGSGGTGTEEKVQSSASPTRPNRKIGSGGTAEKIQSSASPTRPKRDIGSCGTALPPSIECCLRPEQDEETEHERAAAHELCCNLAKGNHSQCHLTRAIADPVQKKNIKTAVGDATVLDSGNTEPKQVNANAIFHILYRPFYRLHPKRAAEGSAA
jgi:hypothetical protein